MDGQPSVLPRLGGTIRAPVSLLPSDASWEHLSTTHGTGVASEQRVRRDGYRGPNEARRKRRDAGGRCAPAGATGRRGCVRANLPAAQSPGLLIMLAYGWQYGGSRGPDSGSIPATVSQDCNVSRGVGLFDLASSLGRQRSVNEVAEEDWVGDFAGRSDGAGRRNRWTTQRFWRTRPGIERLHRPGKFAKSHRSVAGGL